MSWLSTTNKIFQNSSDREHRVHPINGFTPVQNIISETGKCFSILKDENDDNIKTLKWFLWNLRQAVSLSLLPFNFEPLGLYDIVKELNGFKQYYPTISENILIIIDATNYLLDNPYNPKRDKVFEILKVCQRNNEKTALVSMLSRGRVLGWNDALYNEIKRISPDCTIIASKKTLLANAFDKIILPSGGKSSPILNELINCSYGRVTEIVLYDREHVFSPIKKNLPITTKNYEVKKAVEQSVLPGFNEEVNDIVSWENNEYWDCFRKRHGLKVIEDHGLQYVVKARLILLLGNRIVYLRDDVKIINLADIIDEDSKYLLGMKKFPRTLVKNLNEGDLIVLRTSGSGEYLLDVVSMLLQKDGKNDLRKKALEWKEYLNYALQNESSIKIFNLLKEKGHDFSNHLYLWEWTTNHVIGPANDSKFYELIAILDDLGYLPQDLNVVQYAEEKWLLMKELKRYHQRAGVYIRKELLEEIKKTLNKGVSTEDKLTFNLKGVSSGTLSAFRVVGVDPEVQSVPYNEIGLIREIGL